MGEMRSLPNGSMARKIHLYELPPEIRLLIYEYLELVIKKLSPFPISFPNSSDPRRSRTLTYHRLLHCNPSQFVCRRLRSDQPGTSIRQIVPRDARWGVSVQELEMSFSEGRATPTVKDLLNNLMAMWFCKAHVLTLLIFPIRSAHDRRDQIQRLFENTPGGSNWLEMMVRKLDTNTRSSFQGGFLLDVDKGWTKTLSLRWSECYGLLYLHILRDKPSHIELESELDSSGSMLKLCKLDRCGSHVKLWPWAELMGSV